MERDVLYTVSALEEPRNPLCVECRSPHPNTCVRACGRAGVRAGVYARAHACVDVHVAVVRRMALAS